MDAQILFTEESGHRAGKDISSQAEADDPDLVALFPTTAEVNANGIKEVVNALDFNCPVAGVSVAGVATHESGGFEVLGIAAVVFNDLEFDTQHVEDAWEADIDEMVELLTGHDGTIISFGAGARGAKGGYGWKIAQRLAKRVITRDSLGQREKVIGRIEKSLVKNRIGYPNMFKARFIAGQDANVVNFNSVDSYEFLDGYEIWNDDITRGKPTHLVLLEEELETGAAFDVYDSLDTERKVETFDGIIKHGNIVYGLGDELLSDIKERHPIGQEIGRGGFSYYLVLEGEDVTTSIPFSSDLGVVELYTDFDDDVTAHIVQAPRFKEYSERYTQMLEGLDGTPHISINPPQLGYFENKLNRIVEMTEERLDEFLITIDNGHRDYEAPDYNSPGYVLY